MWLDTSEPTTSNSRAAASFIGHRRAFIALAPEHVQRTIQGFVDVEFAGATHGHFIAVLELF